MGTYLARSIYLSIYLPVCLSVCLSIYLSIHLSIHLSIYLSSYLAATWTLLEWVLCGCACVSRSHDLPSWASELQFSGPSTCLPVRFLRYPFWRQLWLQRDSQTKTGYHAGIDPYPCIQASQPLPDPTTIIYSHIQDPCSQGIGMILGDCYNLGSVANLYPGYFTSLCGCVNAFRSDQGAIFTAEEARTSTPKLYCTCLNYCQYFGSIFLL